MNNYDRIINMFCITGKMPVNMIDIMCADAHRQIIQSDKISSTVDKLTSHNDKIYEDINKRRDEFRSDWFDYECHCFAMGGGIC